MASGQRPRRSSQDQKPLNLPPPGHEPRVLARRNSGANRSGQRIDVDGERRSRNRSNSTPPDNRHHHHDHRRQDGQLGLTPASANDSRIWGQQWVNTWWGPGRAQVQVQTQVQVSGQWDVRGHDQLREGPGHREGDRRGRGRRSSDAKRPTPTPAPALRHTSTPPSPAKPPVIPEITTTGGMGFRNLLRKNSHNRPKILFYNKNEPHYGFTNFSPHAVVYNGKKYPTSEHLFQALKVRQVMPVSLFICE